MISMWVGGAQIWPGDDFFKGMLRPNIEHFLKKRKYEKLGFSEMN